MNEQPIVPAKSKTTAMSLMRMARPRMLKWMNKETIIWTSAGKLLYVSYCDLSDLIEKAVELLYASCSYAGSFYPVYSSPSSSFY